MKVKDILNKQCTVLSSVSGWNPDNTVYTQAVMTIQQILHLGYKYNKQIEALRSMPYHSDEQRQFKLKFPCWFVGGTFPNKQTGDEDIMTYSNLLAIDIDKTDNQNIDLDKIRAELYNLPYVIAVLKSISGQGYYVLILVEDGHYTTEYYDYLKLLFKQKYNIITDGQCKNIGRKRFISYEADIDDWVKPDEEEIIPWKLKKTIKTNQTIVKSEPFNPKAGLYDNSFDKERLSKAIWYLLNDGLSVDSFNVTESSNYYRVWYYMGCDFKYFDDGEAMFIKFSQNSSKYNDNINTVINKFYECTATTNEEELSKKYFGMMKTRYGKNWYNLLKEDKTLFDNI